ncbi:MAG TPA: hypothetical protein VJB02_05250 [Coxiellaceae bacterium]|nr:hypothetical protein [Coxiellaceae bacterium]
MAADRVSWAMTPLPLTSRPRGDEPPALRQGRVMPAMPKLPLEVLSLSPKELAQLLPRRVSEPMWEDNAAKVDTGALPEIEIIAQQDGKSNIIDIALQDDEGLEQSNFPSGDDEDDSFDNDTDKSPSNTPRLTR